MKRRSAETALNEILNELHDPYAPERKGAISGSQGQLCADRRPAIVRTIEILGWTISRMTALGLLAYIAYEGHLAAAALPGKESDFVGRMLTIPGVSQIVAWVSCLLGIGYGVLQGRLKQRIVQNKGRRVKELEARINPQRESSELRIGPERLWERW